jgi:hypothetical protein
LFSDEPDNDHCDAVLPVEERLGTSDEVIFQRQRLPVNTGSILLFCRLWYLGVNVASFPKLLTFRLLSLFLKIAHRNLKKVFMVVAT